MSQSPKELIDKQAISEIKSLLINSDMPIKSIASTLHFEDVSYLCRYFRRLTGIPPLEYRENNKE
jgi:AraC family transcriptional activator of pobA